MQVLTAMQVAPVYTNAIKKLSCLTVSPPGGDSLALISFWGEAMVSVTVQIITIAGGALSDPGALPLSPTCPLSVCLSSLYAFVHLSCWREPWDCCTQPLPRTMPGSRCAMHSCQPTHRWK